MATTPEVQQFITDALALVPHRNADIFTLAAEIPLVTFVPGNPIATSGTVEINQATANEFGPRMQENFEELPLVSDIYDATRNRRTVVRDIGMTPNGIDLTIQRGASTEGSYYELIATPRS